MDDVYNLKKQVMTSGCAFQGNLPETKNEAMALSTMRINYASEELGASIINVLAKPIGEVNFIRKLLGLEFMANPPVNMLRSNLLPGSCFGFRGSNATVFLHLAKTIIIEEFSLTHVPKETTPSRCVDNAPKDFEVYGLPPGSHKKELLGQWTYENAPKKRAQSFLCKNTSSFQSLVITFNSNHGANSTCIYRIEVYGKLP
ncbi:GH10752 [Drosophila grimshawi]|uniref:GH10752 n=2 Tax=Drosophila grimshawi TaxID=7222 RepID=B4JBN2_DROGR|nr:GH10752 [Drosophila grimshawi]